MWPGQVRRHVEDARIIGACRDPGEARALRDGRVAPVHERVVGSAGFDVNVVNLRATGWGGGARHVIWIAKKS